MPPSVPPQLGATTASAYRELLKVQRALFRGDAPARAAAHLETRDQFLRHANASPSETPVLIQDAYNTAGFLHENVAQTVLNDTGNYGACHPLLTSRLVALTACVCTLLRRAQATAAAHVRVHGTATTAVRHGCEHMSGTPSRLPHAISRCVDERCFLSSRVHGCSGGCWVAVAGWPVQTVDLLSCRAFKEVVLERRG